MLTYVYTYKANRHIAHLNCLINVSKPVIELPAQVPNCGTQNCLEQYALLKLVQLCYGIAFLMNRVKTLLHLRNERIFNGYYCSGH